MPDSREPNETSRQPTTSIDSTAMTTTAVPVPYQIKPFQASLLAALRCDKDYHNLFWVCQQMPDPLLPEMKKILAERSTVDLTLIWKEAAHEYLCSNLLHVLTTYDKQRLVEGIVTATRPAEDFRTIEAWESAFRSRVHQISLRELFNVVHGADQSAFDGLDELCRRLRDARPGLLNFERRIATLRFQTNSLPLKLIEHSLSSHPLMKAQAFFKQPLNATRKICKGRSIMDAVQLEYLELQYSSWVRHDTGILNSFDKVLDLLQTLRWQGAHSAHYLLNGCQGLLSPEQITECFSLLTCMPNFKEEIVMLESLRQQQNAWQANGQLVCQPITL